MRGLGDPLAAIRRKARRRLRPRPSPHRRSAAAPAQSPTSPRGSSMPRGSGAGLGTLGALLPRRRPRVVAILADATRPDTLDDWLHEFAGDRVVVVSADEAPEWALGDTEFLVARRLERIGNRLRSVGALDVVVCLLTPEALPADAEDHLDVFTTAARYIRRGGVFIHDRRATAGRSEPETLSRWLGILTAGQAEHHDEERRSPEVGRSVGAVAISRRAIVVTKRLDHFVKLRDKEVDELLAQREPSLLVTTMDRRAEGDFAVRATVVSHGSVSHEETLPAVISYPEVRVRHYRGRVAMPGATLMYTGHTILPDSFRWHLTDNPGNPYIHSVSARFARVLPEHRPPRRRRLTGDYYQLDSSFPHHFGHVMTEVVSRLWGWDVARQELPDLRVLLHLKPKSRKDPSLERALFVAYGIPEDRIVWVNEPVWVDSVVSATPMWHNAPPHYAHPDIVETWDRIGSGLTRGLADVPTSDRIFVSRGSGALFRPCRNIEAVEAYFRDRGYEVIYPERLPLGHQARLFSAARVIAGFGGSAMFNLMHAREPERVILLNHDSYIARNEHLFTALTGGEVHYLWSQADLEHPEDGYSLEAFRSPWEFDFSQHGAVLDALTVGG